MKEFFEKVNFGKKKSTADDNKSMKRVNIIEPWHEISNNVVCATSIRAVWSQQKLSAFVICCNVYIFLTNSWRFKGYYIISILWTISVIFNNITFRMTNRPFWIQMSRHMSLFVWFDSLHPSQQSFSYVRMDIPGLNQFWARRINVSCSRTQHSDASEALTRGPSVSSQALYHWATALPLPHEISNNVAFWQPVQPPFWA